MNWTVRYKSRFKKDFKKIKNNRHIVSIFQNLVENYFLKTGTVPSEYLPHPLVGNWKPHMECHLMPDVLLIWEVKEAEKEIVFVRMGSHSDLFG